MRALLSVAILLAACGDDPDATCGVEGSADGEGSVLGAQLGPFARAALITPESRPAGGVAWSLALDEGAGTCGEPGPGRRISVLFCDTPAAMDYPVAVTAAFRCPTNADKVLVLLEDETGADLAEATEGTVTISYAGGCVAGSYELTFGSETVSGAFDAVVCN